MIPPLERSRCRRAARRGGPHGVTRQILRLVGLLVTAAAILVMHTSPAGAAAAAAHHGAAAVSARAMSADSTADTATADMATMPVTGAPQRIPMPPPAGMDHHDDLCQARHPRSEAPAPTVALPPPAVIAVPPGSGLALIGTAAAAALAAEPRPPDLLLLQVLRT